MINTIKRMRAGEEGFTLIELLVVILIIAILVLVGLPAFLGQQEKAKKSGAQQKLRTAYSSAKADAVFNNGNFNTNADSLAAAIEASEPGLDVVTTAGGVDEVEITDVTANTLDLSYVYETGKDPVTATADNEGIEFDGL